MLIPGTTKIDNSGIYISTPFGERLVPWRIYKRTLEEVEATKTVLYGDSCPAFLRTILKKVLKKPSVEYVIDTLKQMITSVEAVGGKITWL